MKDIAGGSSEKKSIPSQRMIESEKVSYRNRAGLSITAYLDHAAEWRNRPFIIVPPAYGETKRDYISLSYYLVTNGFNVLRYDNTCHLGESEGDIVDADLLRMEDDLRTTIDFIGKEFLQQSVAIAATSLSGRVAIRLAVTDSRIAFLCVLVGLVDLRGTLRSIYREDIIEQYKRGKYQSTLDIFGHEVKTTFIQNAIDHHLDDLEGTLSDVRQLRCPMILLAAENDAWINLDDARRLIGSAMSPMSMLRIIPGALHQLQENPRLAKLAIQQVVECCKQLVDVGIHRTEVLEPNIHDIVVQNKLELAEMKRLSTITQSAEKDFWESYLAKFSIALQLPDYRDLLECSERLLGGIEGDARILDAGCGNGHFGVCLLKGVSDRLMTGGISKVSFRYVGLDFAERAVQEARRRHTELLERMAKLNSESNLMGNLDYVVGDLDQELPFPAEYFDKICCNLVISYVRDPGSVIVRFQRVLKRGGRLVVSSLKPYCDLSLIYKKFTETAKKDSDLEEAILLLSNTGKIRRKESEGHYHFFNEEELQEFGQRSGLVTENIVRSCGNQVNVAVFKKA